MCMYSGSISRIRGPNLDRNYSAVTVRTLTKRDPNSGCFWKTGATKGAGDEVNPKPTALRAATHGSPFCIEHKKRACRYHSLLQLFLPLATALQGSRSTNTPPLALRQATTSFYLPFSPPFGGYSAVQAEGSKLFLTQPANYNHQPPEVH